MRAAGNGAKAKVRPLPGNPPHDRLVSRVISFSLKESLRRSLPRHCRAIDVKSYTWRQVCVFQGMAESIWSDVAKSKPKSKSKPNPGAGAEPPPVGRPRAQVEERVGRTTPLLIVRR